MRALPPYGQLLRLTFENRGKSRVAIMPFHEDVVGRPGYLHGGAIAGLLEISAFSALWRALGDDDIVTKPVTVTVDYMRPGLSKTTFAEAVVERLGANIANVEAYAWQEDREQLIASARLNFLLER